MTSSPVVSCQRAPAPDVILPCVNVVNFTGRSGRLGAEWVEPKRVRLRNTTPRCGIELIR